MNKDLGTYFVRVELLDGTGFFMEWPTGPRIAGGGTGIWKPLTATWYPPSYKTEADVIANILYMFLEGNYSCDCNKSLFVNRALQMFKKDALDCGDTLTIDRMILITPTGAHKTIYEARYGPS